MKKIINENYEFITDYVFNSSLVATDIVSWYSCSDPIVWKNKEEKNAKRIELKINKIINLIFTCVMKR